MADDTGSVFEMRSLESPNPSVGACPQPSTKQSESMQKRRIATSNRPDCRDSIKEQGPANGQSPHWRHSRETRLASGQDERLSGAGSATARPRWRRPKLDPKPLRVKGWPGTQGGTSRRCKFRAPPPWEYVQFVLASASFSDRRPIVRLAPKVRK